MRKLGSTSPQSRIAAGGAGVGAPLSEAITTLAIDHYGAKDARAKPFRAFLERYADVPMLEYNLRRADLDDAKRRIVVELFGKER